MMHTYKVMSHSKVIFRGTALDIRNARHTGAWAAWGESIDHDEFCQCVSTALIPADPMGDISKVVSPF